MSLKAIIWIALAMAVSGCGLARVYNKIELGKPLPPGPGLTEVIDEDAAEGDDASQGHVFGISEYYVWHTPLTTSLQTVSIHTDSDKKVTHSMYYSTTVTNFFLTLGMSSTMIIETTVPPELVANPKGVSLREALDRWMFGFEPSEAGMRALTFTAGETQLYGFAVFGGKTMEYLWDLPLSPVLASGYRETFIPRLGGYATITNLGNNHLRIEIQHALISDPLLINMHAMMYLGNLEDQSEEENE